MTPDLQDALKEYAKAVLPHGYTASLWPQEDRHTTLAGVTHWAYQPSVKIKRTRVEYFWLFSVDEMTNLCRSTVLFHQDSLQVLKESIITNLADPQSIAQFQDYLKELTTKRVQLNHFRFVQSWFEKRLMIAHVHHGHQAHTKAQVARMLTGRRDILKAVGAMQDE